MSRIFAILNIDIFKLIQNASNITCNTAFHSDFPKRLLSYVIIFCAQTVKEESCDKLLIVFRREGEIETSLVMAAIDMQKPGKVSFYIFACPPAISN